MLPPFPNPLQLSTRFRIVVSGEDQPDAASIQFTTASGIPVQTIGKPLYIGTNEITWSGTDPAGNLLARGKHDPEAAVVRHACASKSFIRHPFGSFTVLVVGKPSMPLCTNR